MEITVLVYPKHTFYYAITKYGIDHVVMNVEKIGEVNQL